MVRCWYTQSLATQCPPLFCCPPAGGAGQGRAGGGKDESVGGLSGEESDDVSVDNE